MFPGCTLKVATGKDDEGNIIWAEFPKVLEMDEAQTAAVAEQYRGKMAFDVRMASGGNDFEIQVYRGTEWLDTLWPQAGSIEGWVELEPAPTAPDRHVQHDCLGRRFYGCVWRRHS